MLGLLFGLIVGFSLGLTGGGGSIFAVPLLVYGLLVPVHQAVTVSLAAVGATALYGAVTRIVQKEVDIRVGLIFGAAGMAGAPLGTWLGTDLPPVLLLSGFALLMLLVAARMWRQASRRPAETTQVRADLSCEDDGSGPACRLNPETGRLHLSSRCMMMLLVSGVATGLLSGLFGVGGGFIIVPALVLMASLPIRRAVATSLLVIAVVSAAGLVSHALAGRSLDWWLTGLFVLGGLVGMALGTRLSRKLAGPHLQKLFAGMIALVAVFMLVREVI